jgi:hypothetical protein
MTISPFEYMTVKFLDAATGVAAKSVISLIHSSPLSARSPDLCMLWHDGYREKHKIKLLRNLLARNIYGFLKGAVKLAVNFKPLRYAVHGNINSALLVVTSTCGFEASNGAYKTAYVHTDNDDGIFVFGPVKTCGKGEKDVKELALRYKLSVSMNLMRSGMHAFIRVKGSLIDKTLLSNSARAPANK